MIIFRYKRLLREYELFAFVYDLLFRACETSYKQTIVPPLLTHV